jgi:hypothetical protein
MSAQDILGVHLDARPEISDTTSTPADLVLVIDQLDERPFLHLFTSWLKWKLAPRNNQNLRIWIACRTAEYRHELTGFLKDALKSCVVGDLAPLTRQDAAALVASTRTDAHAFLDAVVDNGAGVLASVPLTLKVLLLAYQQDTEMSRWDPKRLYESGLARLAEEHDTNRIPHLENTSREQRLAIAMRIAMPDPDETPRAALLWRPCPLGHASKRRRASADCPRRSCSRSSVIPASQMGSCIAGTQSPSTRGPAPGRA